MGSEVVFGISVCVCVYACKGEKDGDEDTGREGGSRLKREAPM